MNIYPPPRNPIDLTSAMVGECVGNLHTMGVMFPVRLQVNQVWVNTIATVDTLRAGLAQFLRDESITTIP